MSERSCVGSADEDAMDAGAELKGEGATESGVDASDDGLRRVRSERACR